jgi:putative Ca2+/H+ antiporter (TMEM165/GDT1 family)
MEIVLTSALLVAIAEIGDKTQLLAILLAAKFRKPWPIVLGILGATLANHAIAAFAGSELAGFFEGKAFRYAVAASFLAMAAWALIPDKYEESDSKPSRFGPFLTTLIAFFFVEIGDKTQVATVALGARFHDVTLVTLGTTIGMMLANVPAVFLGERATKVLPLHIVRMVAALIFLGLGLWVLAETAGWL